MSADPDVREQAIRARLAGITHFPGDRWPCAFDAEGTLLRDCHAMRMSQGESPWAGGTLAAAKLIAEAPADIEYLLAALQQARQERDHYEQSYRQKCDDLQRALARLAAQEGAIQALETQWRVRAEDQAETGAEALSRNYYVTARGCEVEAETLRHCADHLAAVRAARSTQESTT